MHNNSFYTRFAWATLLVIFLVILAGSLVRMTGSGMGCPDWPRCFGYLIPPTEESQVLWQENKGYFDGQMIVHKDVLYSSKEKFTSGSVFNEENWVEYTEHDYATFNARHTWIEYINRLVGALSGFFVLILFGLTVREVLKKRMGWTELILAFWLIPLLGFQAWLGKTVVDSNLAPAKITAHMFGALLIVALLLWLIRRIYTRKSTSPSVQTGWIGWLALVFILVQIYLGTQVRQEVDVIAKSYDGVERGLWMGKLGLEFIFKAHRSFAWVVLAVCGLLLYNVRKAGGWGVAHWAILLVLVAEVVAGISLSHLGFPALAQPVHIMLACILFSLVLWVSLPVKRVS